MNGTIETVMDDTAGEEIVEWLKFLGITLGYRLLAGLGAIVAFYLLLCITGFACSGILAGSCAACCHSNIGNVKSGSCFACCQSTGAGGMPILNYILFIVGFITAFTLLVLNKVDHGGFHGLNNSTLLVVDSAMNSTYSTFNTAVDSSSSWFNSAMNSSYLWINSAMDTTNGLLNAAKNTTFSLGDSTIKATESLINNTLLYSV